MSAGANLAAIHAVRDAATALTLACVEIVGPVGMALSLPTVKTLGEPVPRKMKQTARKVDGRKK